MSDHILTQLESLKSEAAEAIADVQTDEQLETLRVHYLGRKGALTDILKSLKSLSDDEKRTVGPIANDAKNAIAELLDAKLSSLAQSKYEQLAEKEWIDITEPGIREPAGHIHPLIQVQEQVEDAFIHLGFTVIDTPELESEYYNFEALNIPSFHPARDMQDTFWLENGNLLRTHTSSAQVRMLQEYGAPLRVVQPGRCYRYEATDASHDSIFYQVEGLMVGPDITTSNMIAVITSVLSSIFGKEVKVRIRPGYFPFVEPGMELDFSCLLCDGKGCRVCSHTGWLEFMGCGMVHPNVLKAGNVDPNENQGFAFGFGLTRLVMMRYGIDDIRHLMNGDLRFLTQF